MIFAIVQFPGSAKFVLSGDPLYLQIYSRFNWDNLSISSTFRMCINTNQCNWKDYISWFSTAILQQHWLLLVDPISSWELHHTSVFKFWCEMQVSHSYYFCLYLFFFNNFQSFKSQIKETKILYFKKVFEMD